MRHVFLSFDDYAELTADNAEEIAGFPAAEVVEVEWGFHVFESADDFRTWEKQD